MTYIQIINYALDISVLGPGNRSVVWFSGCHFAYDEKKPCLGCVSEHTWNPNHGKRFDAEDLAARLYNQGNIDGITISGGEFFDQAKGALELLLSLKKLAAIEGKSLNYLGYTGNTYEQLVKNPIAKRVIDELDVLIDGRYVQTLDDGKGLRGSINQRVIHITDKLKESDFKNCKREVQLRHIDNELVTIGIPMMNIKKI
jgi:anaerobic ribonucleoside-triphosphate reductase activating protein